MTQHTYSRLFACQQVNWVDHSTLVALSEALAGDDAPLDARDDSRIPAGYTYLGQFIAHDVSFDDTKGLPRGLLDPNKVTNARGLPLQLSSLYGSGPDGPHAHLYQPDRKRLKPGSEAKFDGIVGYDLPRLQTGVALIADERNDENAAVAQLHACLISFHNKVADFLDARHGAGHVNFKCVRSIVTRHYHAVILQDFLWRVIPDDIYTDVMKTGRRMYHPNGVEPGYSPRLPIEFSHAAFRFGHSMIRARYRWNSYIPVARFERLMENCARNGGPGFKGLPVDWRIDWRNFLDLRGMWEPNGRKAINYARKIDTCISSALAALPSGERQYGEPANLLARDLIRGQALGLTTGPDAISQAQGRFDLDLPILRPRHLQRLSNPRVHPIVEAEALTDKLPLWLYLLAEAELISGGEQLGPFGGRIVMEVLHALIEANPGSILWEKDWQPMLPCQHPGSFTLPDLVTFAGLAEPID